MRYPFEPFETRSARWLRAWLLIALPAGAACSSPEDGVCDLSARVSWECGGFQVSSDDTGACDGRVVAACTGAEQAAYAAYLACASDRCLHFSPDRQIAASCDHLLGAVSASCFAAGVTGNSDYRACGEGVDTCRSGLTCDPGTGTCKAP